MWSCRVGHIFLLINLENIVKAHFNGCYASLLSCVFHFQRLPYFNYNPTHPATALFSSTPLTLSLLFTIRCARLLSSVIMGRGGFQTKPSLSSPSTTLSTSTTSSSSATPRSSTPSIRLQYPKSSRLLLGTTANLQQPGFLRALETHYPLELSFSCESLNVPSRLFGSIRPIHPFAMFFYRSSPAAEWELIGRTETVTYDAEMRFVTKLKVCCATAEDRAKTLRVEVYHRRTKSERVEDQTFIGACECTLEDVIAEPVLRRRMKLVSGKIDDPGWVILAADVVRPMVGAGKLGLAVDMSSVVKAGGKVFYVMSRQGQAGEFTPLYRSEVLGKGEKRFRMFNRDIGAVTAGVEDKVLRLELFQVVKGTARRLGFVQTSVVKLRGCELNSGLVWWPCAGEKGIEVGRVVVIGKDMNGDSLKLRLRVTA